MVDSGAGGGGPWARWAPLTGIAFPVVFVLSVVLSNAPAATAGDAVWTAAYTGAGNQAAHFATGVCLVLAGLCLVSFLTTVWTTVAAAPPPAAGTPPPALPAGVSP